MFRQLKLYYVIISLPFVLLLLGALYFNGAIATTITRNPHPQINYAIFCIILFGGVIILFSAYRLMHAAKTIVTYSSAVHSGADAAALQQIAASSSGDISYLLQMIAASTDRTISHQEQVSIEHELENARASLHRRNSLPQYLTGLLVGMGLLGTFVGLLATLTDISILISSFSELDMATASPLVVFRTMIDRMKAPMQSMGIAFSASMFGLLGSIILGLMMVGIRRMQGDISSLLGSEVARHIELSLSHETVQQGAQSAVFPVRGITDNSEQSKTLLRIEERLAESLRLQQRTLSAALDDFHQQRLDMLQALTGQFETNSSLRVDLQQMDGHLADLLATTEKSNNLINMELSDFNVAVTANAKESGKLLSMQIDELKRLRESLDSCKIEERLAEAAHTQQRALTAELDNLQKQRTEILRTQAAQTEASTNLRQEIQQLGRHIGSICSNLDKNNGDMSAQLSELIVHLTANAKESHNLLAMQIEEQRRLRETLDWRTNNPKRESLDS